MPLDSCTPLRSSDPSNYRFSFPCRISALRRVFFSSMATVIGPTPPGTGVMLRGLGFDRVEVDIADGFFGSIRQGHAIDADVDDDRAVACT